MTKLEILNTLNKYSDNKKVKQLLHLLEVHTILLDDLVKMNFKNELELIVILMS